MILEVKNLVKQFKKGKQSQLAVDHVSFALEEKKCLGIIGESGSGKSTTANMIAGFLKPDGGSILFEGEDLCQAKGRKSSKLRQHMQMVFQNPQESFNPKMKLKEAICEPLLCLGIRGDLQSRLMQALELVELKKEYADKYPWEISGGECQRAAIARAIICEPRLLICDEVTSALDVSVQAQIIRLLNDLKTTLGMSCIFISHDLASVSSICDDIAVMYKGKYLEYGKTMDVVRSPGHPYTRDLLENALHPGEEPVYENPENTIKSRCIYAGYCREFTEKCREWKENAVVPGLPYSMCHMWKEI